MTGRAQASTREGGRVRRRDSARNLAGTPELVRLLADPSRHAADPRASFAERLGQWLDWTDAIALSAVLGGAPAAPESAPEATPESAQARAASAAQSLGDEVRRVRTELVAAIRRGFDGADAAAVSAAACRRRCTAQQRLMCERLGPLRASVRAVLAKQSPALARLAALDAVMDQALAARERQLLSHVSGLLEPRLERLRQPGGAQAIDEELQRVLLAELELRLQPIEGMMSALEHGTRRRP
jgi:hypothetical protein